MHLDYKASLTAGYSIGIDPSGREHVVVAIKRDLAFPEQDGGLCRWTDDPSSLCLADEFTGEPPYAATLREADFALRKPKCDVLLAGSAHAPDGRPVDRLRVGLAIGRWTKSLDVVGDRVWLTSVLGLKPSAIQPFVRQSFSYDTAFGGLDNLDPKNREPEAYRANPAGRGWCLRANRGLAEGMAMPNTEKPGEPVELPWGDYLPMALGPIGRSWTERAAFAGTYDQDWIDNTFPFLPRDFDDRYYQSAPADQQIAYPTGGEEIRLMNLMPGKESIVTVKLPALDLPVLFQRRGKDDLQGTAVVDGLMIEPDRRRIGVTWRASMPLDRDIFDVVQCIIGTRSKAFWRARALGKAYNGPLRHIGTRSEDVDA